MLARLLSPAEFGVVGAALIVISFTELFSEAGVPATLIQKRELSEVDIRVALLVSLLIAWTLYALVDEGCRLCGSADCFVVSSERP